MRIYFYLFIINLFSTQFIFVYIYRSNSESMALLDDSSDVFERITSDIEHLLNRLTQINNNMSDYIKHIQNPSAVYTVQRHREILNDYSNEFRKTRSNIVQLIEREQLIQVSSNKKVD